MSVSFACGYFPPVLSRSLSSFGYVSAFVVPRSSLPSRADNYNFFHTVLGLLPTSVRNTFFFFKPKREKEKKILSWSVFSLDHLSWVSLKAGHLNKLNFKYNFSLTGLLDPKRNSNIWSAIHKWCLCIL